MKCQKCGNEVEEGAKFCPKCGTAVVDTIECPKCGKINKKENQFCSECGASLTPKVVTPEDQAKKEEQNKSSIKKADSIVNLVLNIVFASVLILAGILAFTNYFSVNANISIGPSDNYGSFAYFVGTVWQELKETSFSTNELRNVAYSSAILSCLIVSANAIISLTFGIIGGIKGIKAAVKKEKFSIFNYGLIVLLSNALAHSLLLSLAIYPQYLSGTSYFYLTKTGGVDASITLLCLSIISYIGYKAVFAFIDKDVKKGLAHCFGLTSLALLVVGIEALGGAYLAATSSGSMGYGVTSFFFNMLMLTSSSSSAETYIQVLGASLYAAITLLLVCYVIVSLALTFLGLRNGTKQEGVSGKTIIVMLSLFTGFSLLYVIAGGVSVVSMNGFLSANAAANSSTVDVTYSLGSSSYGAFIASTFALGFGIVSHVLTKQSQKAA